MSTDAFRSPKQRLARAKEKTAELKVAIAAFVARKPYASVVDVDPADSSTKRHKIKMTEPVPDLLTNLSMEVIEALRSALDQVGFACAALAGKPNAKSAYYPFADTGAELANTIKGRCKDLPSDIVSLFRSFQPYKGGNDPLWAMNKIANTKHSALVPVGTAAGGFFLKSGTISGGSIMFPSWDSAKHEMIFGRTGPQGSFEYELEFTLAIAFGDVPVLKGQPVPAVLDHLAGIVESILAATEAECRRIGLVKN
jgi:hypothetical protein